MWYVKRKNKKNELFSRVDLFILHNAVWRKFLNKIGNSEFSLHSDRLLSSIAHACQARYPIPGHFQPGSGILSTFVYFIAPVDRSIIIIIETNDLKSPSNRKQQWRQFYSFSIQFIHISATSERNKVFRLNCAQIEFDDILRMRADFHLA